MQDLSPFYILQDETRPIFFHSDVRREEWVMLGMAIIIVRNTEKEHI